MKKKQARLGLLAAETFCSWGWGNAHIAIFPAGTLCRIADTLPDGEDGQKQYWIVGKPSTHKAGGGSASKTDFASWQDTYGFRVSAGEVVAKTKKKSFDA